MRQLRNSLAVALLLSPLPLFASDECHARFAYYLAAQPYIVNAAAGDRAATTIVAVLEDMSLEATADVVYRLEVVSTSTGDVVRAFRGVTQLHPREQRELAFRWNGRDESGRLAGDGEYAIRMHARQRHGRDSFDGAPAASGSEVNVVVDQRGRYDHLFERDRYRPIESNAASLDATFPYQFFFGTTHAHSNWSDGGMPVSDCASGRYGYAGGARPSDAWSYAKTTGSVNFLAIVEHNHLMQEACSGCTAQGVKDRYAAGFTNAASATVNGSFVGLFGMEWGVIEGGGHINIYNQSKLMSWDAEPYHVYTAKSSYPPLYTAIKNNQGTYGSYGTFNHPEITDFGSFQRTADGDAVMRGLSMISGPAFSTSTSFTPGGTRYKARFDQALRAGWKVAPEAHQDNHCWNYGSSTPNRTVALVPNGTTFSQSSLVAAYGARRFYASEDRNAQLVFRTADGTRVMGAVFSSAANVSVNVAVDDPNGDGVQKIEIWGGQAGTSSSPGAAPTVLVSNTGSKTLATSLFKRTVGTTWYYYVVAVQADGNTMWSAPMFITWN
jgi:hypothetical protein